MKKLYATQRARTLKVFRFSFVKALSLATATTFLSNISPVFASNLAITGAKVLSQNDPNVNYPKGSHGSIVLSGDDDYCGADNVIGRGGTTKRGGKKITAEEEYRRFLEEVKFGNFSPYSHSDKQLVWTGNGQTSGNIGYMGGLTGGDANIMPEAFGVYSFATGCGSAAQGSYSTAFGANATALTGGSLAFGVASLAAGKVSIAVGVGSEAKGDSSVALGGLANAAGEISVAIGHKAQSTGKFAITMGDQAQATKEDSLAIGRMAHALGKSSTALGSEYNVKSEHGDNDYTTAQGDYSTALGAVSKALGYGSTAVGHRAYATQKDAVSIGFYSRAKADHAVALGADSIATVEAGVAGYSPFLQGVATDTTFTWKSTYGAVSVGDITNGKTRQIGGVAAGSANTDAVNVAQLKSLKMYVDKGWKLSVDGKNAKAVGIDNTVDFATGSNNLSITKGEKDNNIKFDLAKNITLDSVTAGKNIFDATGLKITDGPQITTAGINAGSKRITNVANGTDTTDAVNFGQLDKAKKEVQEQVEKQVQEVEKQIASNSFVKQDAVTQHITIGKDTGGDKIDITNNNKETRTLTGIKNGDISKDSKEAVTGSQLFETNQSVNTVSSNLQTAATDIAKSFGGGAGYKDGKWTDPTFTVKTVTDEGNEENATYHNVAEALTGVGTSITNVKNEITKEVNNTINTVKGDSLLWSADDQAFSAQHKNEGAKANSKITHLLDGNIASGSTDAITGNQLYSLGDKVATYFGGNARYENGVWTDPTFKIKRVKADGTEDEQNYTSVAAAFEGVGTAFTNIKNEMTNQINNAITNVQGDSLIKKDPKTNYITIGKEVAGGEINIANNANEARTLSGVKDAVKNNEAINKGQFDKGIENVSKDITNKFNDFTQNITNITQQVQGDALLWSESENAFIAAHGKDDAKTNSKITHLLDGNIASDSTDAITGKQLYTLGDKVAQSFGGDARYENGEWTSPTFKIKTVNGEGEEKEETYKNVSEALTGVGTSITNVQNKVTEQINNVVSQVAANSFVQQDDTTKRITIGAKEEGSEINIANKNNEDRILSGVKEATKNNEAVNKAQLDTNIKKVEEKLAEAVGNVTQQVQGDALLWSNTDNAFVADHKKDGVKTKSKITHLSDGNIASGSTDAVTGGQLYSMNEQLATYLGGGAGYDEKGNWKAPSFKVKTVKADGNSEEKNYSNVSAAFEGVGTSITNVQNKITNEITNQINHLQSDDSAVVHYDKQKNGAIDYASVTFGGKDKTLTALHNIADGQIADKSHDAITGGQINSISQDVARFLGGGAAFSGGAFTQPTYKLSQVDANGKVNPTEFKDVGSAFSGLDENIKNVNDRIKEVSEGVAQDSLNWNEQEKAFVAQHGVDDKKADSKITHLKAGDISAASTEAVNGSQLYYLGNNIAQYFGGGTEYKDGKWTAPSFKFKTVKEDGVTIEDKEYGTIAEAFTGVGSSFEKLQKEFNQSITNITQEVQGDALLWDKQANAFIAQHGEKEGEKTNSKITSLLDGAISKGSTDAITGGQLYGLGSSVAKSLGGGAGYENGVWTGPSFKFKTVKDDGSESEEKYENVSDAFAGVGNSFTNIKNEITNQINHLQSDDSAVVHYNKTAQGETDYTNVTFGGKDKTAVGLHNIADGSIAENSRDAINGGQINKIGESVAKYLGGNTTFTNGVFSTPTYSLSKVEANGSVGSASFDNIGSAFTGLDENIKNVNNRIKEVSEGVAQDSLNWSKDSNAFVAQHGDKKTNSKITSLANGEISATSSDAVAGNQLHTLGSNVAKSLGGGAGYENGVWNAPSFKVKTVNEDGSKVEDKDYSTVEEAFAGVGSSFEKLHKEFTESNTAVTENIQQNALLWSDSDKAFVAQHGEKEGAKTNSKIKYLAAGEITKDSTEAVIGSQLYSLQDQFAGYLGGGAGYDKAGKWNNPTFKVNTVKDDGASGEESYNNVAEAFEGVGSSFTNIKNEITNQINHLQSDDSAVVHYDKKEKDEIDYTNVTLGKGKDSSPVGLHNVADGKIADKSHDAITGGQINSIGDDIAKFLGGDTSFKNGAFTGPTYRLSSVSKEGEVTGRSFTDVGSAFTGLDENIKNVNDRIKEVSQGVAQDSLSWSKDDNAFSAQHGEDKNRKDSKITHILDGNIASGSTDAVTGGQLYSMNNTLSSYLGGGAGYKEGKWTAPNFKVNTVNTAGDKVEEKSYDSVAAAFEGVGTSFTNLHNEVTNAVTNINNHINDVVSDSLVKQDADSKVIKIGAEKGGTSISIANSGDAARTLTGVKAGALSETSTDAVNGSQLYSMNNTLASYFGGGAKYENGQWTAPSFKIQTVSEDGSKVEEQSYKTVAEAFAGVGSSFTNIHKELKNEINQVVGDSLVKQDDKTHDIAVGGEKSGTKVTFANTDGATRILTGITAGELTEASTEAVNGSQLFATNQNVTIVTNDLKTVSDNTSKYLGGGADVVKGVAPNYTVEGKSYESVADAFGGVDRSFTELHKEITQNTNEVSENIKQNALLWSDKDHAFVATHGTDDEKKNSKITSLANGSVTKDSTDAINGSQLYSMNNTLASYFGDGAKYENDQWTAPTFKVSQFSGDGKSSEETYNNVADAFDGVNSSFKGIHNEMTSAVTNINNQINKIVSDSLVKKDATTDLITIGKEVVGTEVNIANKDQEDRTLSGVKAAVNDNEAVNKGQLDKSLEQLSNSLQSDDSAVVLYDKKENGETDYTNVTFGKGQNAAPVALHNVADGKISENSHDAVTGGQINTIGSDVAKFLGGGSSFKGGTLTEPSYKLTQVDEKGVAKEAEFKDVGSAFAGLDKNINNVNNHLTNVVQDFTQQITDITEEVKDDALLWSQDKEAFVATHGADGDKNNSKITSLANGSVTKDSTDAVNGSQLFETNQHVSTVSKTLDTAATGIAKSFGGGAKYENGQWSAPIFKVHTVSEDGSKVEEQSYDDVAKAFASVGNSFSSLHKELKNEISQVVSDSLVKQDETTKVIKIGAEKEGTEISIANSDGAERLLTGVKSGALTEASTEAVNGGQLYSMNNTLASYFGGGAGYKEGEWTTPSFKIVSFKEDGSSEETSYDNVAAAFAGINTSFTKLHHDLTDNIEQNALLWSEAEGSFVALHGKGSEKQNSKLSHLVDGDISSGSTEAITGNQLYQLNQTLAQYFGGGASYQGGQWRAPDFKVAQLNSDGSSGDDKVYHDVAGAFGGVSDGMKSINDRINDVANNLDTNSLSWNDELGGYDGRHNGSDSKITHVADGEISEGSKEVVNGGQLWETNQKVSAVENRVESLDQHVKDVESAVTNGAVNYDKDAEGNKTNKITLVGGDESAPVLIENVGDGKIEKGSHQAVNGGQLHDYTEQQMKLVLDDAKKYTDDQVSSLVNNGVNEAKSYTDMKFETLNYAIEDVRKEARQAAAIGLAVSNLRYYDIPGSLSVSFGSGLWRSQSAFAIGAGYTSEDGNIRSNVSVTSAGGHWGIGAGITLRLR
ncbi:Vomp family autotransporter [Bartonella queenslandensis]|uniref:Vomp family autotransporter n=3 Tax=Bartonella TaxID=773 RepID=UPI002467E0FB|nr:Vomp family autotransporter [Bartonella queenslandensis]